MECRHHTNLIWIKLLPLTRLIFFGIARYIYLFLTCPVARRILLVRKLHLSQHPLGILGVGIIPLAQLEEQNNRGIPLYLF